VLNHLAFHDRADDIPQTGILGEQIFAGLEFGTRFQGKNGADEGPSIVVDDAFALQDIGDIGHSCTRRNVDDLFLLQWTRRLDLLLAVDIAAAGRDHANQNDGDDGVAHNDEGISGALRPPGRRGNLLRLERGARTAWGNGRPLTHRCNLNPVARRFKSGLANLHQSVICAHI
jgi:hypothetical protein